MAWAKIKTYINKFIMKIDIIFVHFAVVAAVSIPYILFVLAAAMERKRLRLAFEKEAQQHNLNPEQVDKWNSNIIGIDKTRQKVLLVQRRRADLFVQVIDLRNVKSSVLLHELRSMKIDGENENVLQRIDVELSLYNGEKQVVTLFDSDMTYSQDYEMKNAEKWNKILNAALGMRPLLHSAA